MVGHVCYSVLGSAVGLELRQGYNDSGTSLTTSKQPVNTQCTTFTKVLKGIFSCQKTTTLY